MSSKMRGNFKTVYKMVFTKCQRNCSRYSVGQQKNGEGTTGEVELEWRRLRMHVME